MLCGTEKKAVRITSKFQVEIAPGKINAHRELPSCSVLLMSR